MIRRGLVAICVPYYKKYHCLKRLINSILEQEYSDYIVIIADDSNDENIKTFVKSLGDKFIFIHNSQRIGATANCNRTIKEAQKFNPEFIKIMHQDDYFSFKYSLKMLVLGLEKQPDSILAFSNSIEDDTFSGKFIRDLALNEVKQVLDDRGYLYYKNVIGAPSMVLIRNCEIYMDENLIWVVDVDWYLKLLREKNQFVYIEEPLITIGIDHKRLTDECQNNKELIQREMVYLYVKHYNLQRDMIAEKLVSKCVREYDGKKYTGFYVKNEYFSIIKDALNDNCKIYLWLEKIIDNKQIAKIEKIIGNKIEALFFENEQVMDMGRKESITFDELMDNKSGLCIIVKEKAIDIRKHLNAHGINAVPYIKEFFE